MNVYTFTNSYICSPMHLQTYTLQLVYKVQILYWKPIDVLLFWWIIDMQFIAFIKCVPHEQFRCRKWHLTVEWKFKWIEIIIGIT